MRVIESLQCLVLVNQEFVGLNTVCHLAVEISYLLLKFTISLYQILDPKDMYYCIFVSMRSDHLCDASLFPALPPEGLFMKMEGRREGEEERTGERERERERETRHTYLPSS